MKKIMAILIMFIVSVNLVMPVFAGEQIFTYIVGQWQGQKNNLNFAYPYKGDVYFGGNTGGKYGHYTHVALARTTTLNNSYNFTYGGDDIHPAQTITGYGWTGMTIEATTTSNYNDVISRPVQRFWYYDWAAIGYVNNATSTIRNNAVNTAMNYSGYYDWKSGYTTNSSWQCSKLVTRAYDDVSNVILGDFPLSLSYPILPDHIYYDPDITIYTTSSAVNELALPQHAKERLLMWKEKGVDISNIQFEDGIHKKGFNKYLLKYHEEAKDKGMFKENIKQMYKINDEQYMQIINDGKVAIR